MYQDIEKAIDDETLAQEAAKIREAITGIDGFLIREPRNPDPCRIVTNVGTIHVENFLKKVGYGTRKYTGKLSIEFVANGSTSGNKHWRPSTVRTQTLNSIVEHIETILLEQKTEMARKQALNDAREIADACIWESNEWAKERNRKPSRLFQARGNFAPIVRPSVNEVYTKDVKEAQPRLDFNFSIPLNADIDGAQRAANQILSILRALADAYPDSEE